MPQTTRRFRLVLEDENLAAWMVINNTFTWTPPKPGETYNPATDYWTGVLFQLGTYEDFATKEQMAPFGSIKFLKEGKEVDLLTNEDFAEGGPMWVNVVVRAPKSDKKSPMKVSHLRALRVSKMPRPGKLDFYFDPYAGGITFWSERGFTLKMEGNPKRPTHYQFVFDSLEGDSVAVEAYKGEKHRKLQPFDEIQVLDTPGLPEGGHSSPPQDP